MEITVELLEKLGFIMCENVGVFPKLYKKGQDPETYISVEKDYVNGLAKETTWKVHCWRCDERGAIIKRVIASGFTDMDELKRSADLCGVIF